MCDQLLLTVPQAAKILGLGRSYVYQALISTGDLRSIKIGGARRVHMADVTEYAERLRSGGQKPSPTIATLHAMRAPEQS